VRRFLKVLGPGLITGASDDDPSGIGTYAVAGASLGYGPLWLAPFTFPLMASVQFICAKIGLVSGRGLAGVLREHYPKALLYPVLLALLVANTINAGVDIGAIAAGINLLVPALPIPLLVLPVTVAIVALQIWGSYRLIARTFKWLTLALFAYIGSALFARPDLGEVLKGTFLPALHWNGPFLATVVAILGTTISPYLFFWQASQEVEEKRALGRKRLWQRRGTSDAELKYAALDVNVGMLFSNLVMYFIILASAATLYTEGARDIQTAADAARALRPLAGDAAALLMALGLVGSGFLAVPVLTGSASYAIVGSSLVGMLVNFVGVNPMQALFWTAVLNGFLAPPLLVVIMLIAGNRRVMGRRANGPALTVLGWATTALMFAAAVGLLLTGTAGK
jgi:NRAMP (natural resistance-associated macrophage protein)-like metal ion transporter